MISLALGEKSSAKVATLRKGVRNETGKRRCGAPLHRHRCCADGGRQPGGAGSGIRTESESGIAEAGPDSAARRSEQIRKGPECAVSLGKGPVLGRAGG